MFTSPTHNQRSSLNASPSSSHRKVPETAACCDAFVVKGFLGNLDSVIEFKIGYVCRASWTFLRCVHADALYDASVIGL